MFINFRKRFIQGLNKESFYFKRSIELVNNIPISYLNIPNNISKINEITELFDIFNT